MVGGSPSRWLVRAAVRPQCRIRIFCFPCAGGAANSFHRWSLAAPPWMEVVGVELPGHGTRFREPRVTRFDELVRDATDALPTMMDRPFALLGHSMGALLAFEVARALRRLSAPAPEHLFVAARRAPHLPAGERGVQSMTHQQFIQTVKEMNGMPAEAWGDEDLLDLVLPVLRADLEAMETHRYTPEPPLGCPITAFRGLQDVGNSEAMIAAWQTETAAPFALRTFPGDHFFVRSDHIAVLRAVTDSLGDAS